MHPQVIIVTGAAGFLGSAVTVDLSREHRVAALDRREPSAALVDRAAGAVWHQVDIAAVDAVDAAFARIAERWGRIDLVLHFAAFYHFGADWRPEYESTNLRGTAHVLGAAAASGAKRFLFASSVAAMAPPPIGGVLTEQAPTADYIPYARSKSLGEQMVRAAAGRLPSIVLRIGGVFSDWSELPPLTSLLRRWAGRSPLGRLVPGRGTTGMPYLHRDDLVRMVRQCVLEHHRLSREEVFLACQDGATLHKELFAAIAGRNGAAAPIFLPAGLARIGLWLELARGCLVGRPPYERPWMLRYVDRPWVADASYARTRLSWSCTEGLGILQRIPVLLEHFRQHRRTWDERNRMRDRGQYLYRSDAHGDGRG